MWAEDFREVVPGGWLPMREGLRFTDMDPMIDDFKLTYPICIDTPATKDGPGFGELYAAYGVDAIPHVFVIGADGRVAGHGSLGKMLELARSLAKPPG